MLVGDGAHTYFFDGIVYYVPEHCHRALLAHTDSSSDGLLFHGRVPLRLNNVYVLGRCEIQAVEFCTKD